MSNRLPLGACVRGPSAWILWQTARDSLRSRLRQLQLDAGVDPAIVRGFHNTIEDLELAALQFRDWEMARRSVSEFADSAEVPGGGDSAGLESPPRWVDAGLVAASLGCSVRWVTQLCLTGRLAATKRGRSWLIDPSSVEDFQLRGANAA
jgi:hypothetical protein